MKVRFLLWTLLAIVVPGEAARATSTTCSNPAREGVRARAETRMRAGGEAELKQVLETFAAREDLSVGGVESHPSRRAPWRVNNIMLQSPRVTVLLEIEIDSRRPAIVLSVTRTCINDARLEAWRPYWRALTTALRSQGYVIAPMRPARRARRR